MERTQILAGILKRFGNFSITTFTERILLQKRIYFLQVFGLNLGYTFSYYLHGPYSKELADEGFKIFVSNIKTEELFFLREENERKFKLLLEFFGQGTNNPRWLEITSSLHLKHQLNPSLNKNQIIQYVMEDKNATFDECNNSWTHLEKYKLV